MVEVLSIPVSRRNRKQTGTGSWQSLLVAYAFNWKFTIRAGVSFVTFAAVDADCAVPPDAVIVTLLDVDLHNVADVTACRDPSTVLPQCHYTNHELYRIMSKASSEGEFLWVTGGIGVLLVCLKLEVSLFQNSG